MNKTLLIKSKLHLWTITGKVSQSDIWWAASSFASSSASNFSCLRFFGSIDARGFHERSNQSGKTRRYKGIQITSSCLIQSLNMHFMRPCVPNDAFICPYKTTDFLVKQTGDYLPWDHSLCIFRRVWSTWCPWVQRTCSGQRTSFCGIWAGILSE